MSCQPVRRCLVAALAIGFASAAEARRLPLPSDPALARSTAIARYHAQRQHVGGGFLAASRGAGGVRLLREERGVAITPGPIAPPSGAESRAGLRWRQLFWFHARAIRTRSTSGRWSAWTDPGDEPVFGCLVRIYANRRETACVDPGFGGGTGRTEGRLRAH
ncbi:MULTISPECIES: hypothetical protein [Methylobacteriaceae]|jgi:hypothetical protein|uniref:Uncharacterized protein n=2 Tax=Methylobacteriaceae TaxID=119045 RepID=A0A169QKY4_9HYPH|nr:MULTISPECIES: hypothetical protein [Methylobacteriaceae]MBY0254972.1 hypothetical protein [Methylobacterium organophilum]MDV2984026.1 hypothetical protein [Methylobacteriaceae bacterium AG10]BAU89056.1 hypothetical protein MPPM_0451 [Methylorubrum populi]GJE28762.1 hypothetical protein LKMONMHP_3636 [Methylobacterium organophilum]